MSRAVSTVFRVMIGGAESRGVKRTLFRAEGDMSRLLMKAMFGAVRRAVSRVVTKAMSRAEIRAVSRVVRRDVPRVMPSTTSW